MPSTDPTTVVPPAQQRWLLGLVMAAIAGAFVYVAVLILREPYVLNYTEGILLHAARRLAAGESIYRSLAEPPYSYYSYGPLHALLSAPLVATLGNGVLPLRVLTLIGELLIAAFVYRVLVTHRLHRWHAAAGAMLVLGALGLHKFHAIARVDMPMLAAEMWGLSEIHLYLHDKRKRHLVRFTVAQLLALLFKPTAVILLGGTGLLALWELGRDRERGIALLLATMAPALLYGLAVLLLSLATGGTFFLFQFTYQSASGFCNPLAGDCFWEILRLKIFLLQYGSFLAVTLASAILLRGHGYLLLLALLSASWLFLANLKDGADLNYNIELVILLGTIAGLSLPRWHALLSAPAARVLGPRLGHWAAALGLPLLLALALASPALTGLPVRDWLCKPIVHPTREQTAALVAHANGTPDDADLDAPIDLLSEAARADRRAIAALTRQATGVLLAEEPLFAVLADKPAWVTDSFQTHLLGQQNMFDATPIIEACRDGRIQWVFAGWRLMRLPGLPEILEAEFEPVYRTRTPIASSFWTVYRRR